MGDTAAALRMLDTFASCGAESFFVSKTELEWPGHKKAKWGKEYQTQDLRRLMPAMVRTAAIRKPIQSDDGETFMAGENLIIRPIGTGVASSSWTILTPSSSTVSAPLCLSFTPPAQEVIRHG